MIDSFKGKYDFLSNFAHCLFEHEGIIYPSVEHAFQAAKCIHQSDKLQIAFIKTPAAAKQYGSKVEIRQDWEQVKLDIMYKLLLIKFSIPAFKKKLLATGDIELIEGNTWGDRYWGVCRGQGENHLGKLLMRIRKEIRDATSTR